MDRFDLGSLDLFTRVVDAGSINAAAAAVGRSQQSVSERMRRLESELGVDLLERGARGTRPTPTGEIVAGWTVELLDAQRVFAERLEALRADRTANLRVAASQTIAGYLLPGWLGELRRREAAAGEPIASPHVAAVNSAEVIREVRAGEVALGFVETLDLPDGLAMRTVGHDELVVVVAPDHPWTGRDDGISAAELVATPLALREPGSGTRQVFERLLDEAATGVRRAPPAAEFSAVTSVRGAVAAGIAPSVMSAVSVADDLAAGRLVRVPITGMRLTRPFTAVWRDDRTLPETAAELIAIAAESAPAG